MPRRTIAIALAATLAVGTAATAFGDERSDSEAEAAPSASLCLGTWTLKIADGPSDYLPALVSFDGDGSVVYAETSAISSLTPGVPTEFTSPGLGRWWSTKHGCTYRILVNAADVHGNETRTSDITGSVSFGQSHERFTGPVHIAVSHPHLRGSVVNTSAIGARIGR